MLNDNITGYWLPYRTAAKDRITGLLLFMGKITITAAVGVSSYYQGYQYGQGHVVVFCRCPCLPGVWALRGWWEQAMGARKGTQLLPHTSDCKCVRVVRSIHMCGGWVMYMQGTLEVSPLHCRY